MRAIFFISPIIFIFVSCGDPAYPLKQLEGKWHCQMPDGSWISESWESINHDVMKGVGKEVRDDMEVVKEFLELRREGDALIYSATVPSQNDGKPIDFKCDSTGHDFIRFVNRNHDFPQFIVYQWIDPIHMKVTVGNSSDNKFVLDFSKSKN